MNPITNINDGRLRFSDYAELEQYAVKCFELHKVFERDISFGPQGQMWTAEPRSAGDPNPTLWRRTRGYNGLIGMFKVLVVYSLSSKVGHSKGWDQWGYWAITGVTLRQFRHWFDYCVASFDDWWERCQEADKETYSGTPVQTTSAERPFDPEDAEVNNVEDAPF